MQTPSVVEYSVDAQIDVLDTQPFTGNQIDDTCEHVHACNLGCHSRTHFQRDCNFTDCHDHHTTSTFALVFEASIPITFHRLPRLRILTSVKDYFPLSLCADVGPVVGFRIVFSLGHVSRIRHCSKSVQRPSCSTMSVGSSERVRFSLCTSVQENSRH